MSIGESSLNRWTPRPYDADLLLRAAGLPVLAAAKKFGVSNNQVYRWIRSGMTAAQADEGAVALGFHPAEVWPDWFTDGLTAADAIFVESGWRTAWLWKEAS